MENSSNWENNCNSTWIGNQHRYIDIGNKELPFYKKLFGKTLYKCGKCGKVIEGYSNSGCSIAGI